MTGYRIDVSHATHLYEECVPRHPPQEVIEVVRDARGRWFHFLPLMNAIVTVHICARCLARRRAATP